MASLAPPWTTSGANGRARCWITPRPPKQKLSCGRGGEEPMMPQSNPIESMMGRTPRHRMPSNRFSDSTWMLAWRLVWRSRTSRRASILLQVFFCDRPACPRLRWVSTQLLLGEERADGCSGGERDEGCSCGKVLLMGRLLEDLTQRKVLHRVGEYFPKFDVVLQHPGELLGKNGGLFGPV